MKEELKNQLRENVMEITFTKKDGSERVMICTLQGNLIDSLGGTPKGTGTKKSNDDVIPVFDLEKKSWRSFRVDSIVKSVIIPYIVE